MYNYIDENLALDEILVYLRKSRSDDALLTVEEVLAKHESILDEWAENNLGEKIPEGNKFREVVSGETIEDRPQIKEVLKRIESPRIKAILVVEVQRLSRGDLEDAGRLIKLLRYTNTLVITPQKTYDLRNEYDRDFFERELKRGNEFLEYQKKIMERGRILSVQQGNYIGSKPPYGYERITIQDGKKKCPTLKIKEDEANVVRMIFDMYVNEDLGRAKIAQRLDELGVKPPNTDHWSKSWLVDLLNNVHYIGKVKWNWRKTVTTVEDGEIVKTRPKTNIKEYLVFEGKHDAIISEELFKAAQEKQGRNYRARKTTTLRNPFAGLLQCKCGRAMSLRTYVNKDGSDKSPPRMVCDLNYRCDCGTCRYEELQELVCNALTECINDFEVRIQNDDKTSALLHENLIKTLEHKLSALEEKEINLWDKYSEEGMPKHIFEKLNEKILKEKDETTTALCTARESAPQAIDYEEKLSRFKAALEALQDDEKPASEKNKLLKACIEKIIYTREKPQRILVEKKKRITVNGKRVSASGLPRGGNWTSPEIHLEVKLKV
jgi:hypothetical protein